MSNVLNGLSTAVKAVGSVVDALIPFGVGDRTKVSLTAASVLPMIVAVFSKVAPVVASAYPASAPVIAAVPSLLSAAAAIAAALAPLFAAAGLARKLSPAPAPVK